MGDYEELVELGFEGVDKFATRFHDPVVDKFSRHKPFGSHRKKDRGRELNRELPDEDKPPTRRESPQRREPSEERDLPPHPQWQGPPPPAALPYQTYQPYPGGPHSAIPGVPPAPYPGPRSVIPAVPVAPYPGPQFIGQPQRRQLPRQRSYSDPRGERFDNRSVPDDRGDLDSDSDLEKGPGDMYSSYGSERRGDYGWRDDDRYERVVEDREYYAPRGTVPQVEVHTRYANRYHGALTPRVPSPTASYAYTQRGYTEGMRGRPTPRRQRSSSWAAPRRSGRRYDSPSRRTRSKSPNHHRALAIVMGAVVGGMAGSQVKRRDTVPNTMATVGGAILGGLAGREVEQEVDWHKERLTYDRGGVREKRRVKREYICY